MKRFLVFLFILSVKLSFAQTYHPFPDSGARWGQYYYFLAAQPGGWSADITYGYVLYQTHDTVIKNMKYSLLAYLRTWGAEDSQGQLIIYGLPDSVKGEIFGALREDSSKRIWYKSLSNDPFDSHTTQSCYPFPINLKSDTEILLYNFNLKVGDTIYWSEASINQPRIVSNIDSVQFNDGNYRRRFLFQYNGKMSDCWIEGMGSTYGLFGAYYPVIYDGDIFAACALNCFWLNGSSAFETSFPTNSGNCSSLQYGETGIRNIESPNNFSFYPNPAEKSIFLHFNDVDSKFIEIKNLLGETIFKQSVFGKDCSLNTSVISAGIYFILISYGNNTQLVKKLIKS